MIAESWRPATGILLLEPNLGTNVPIMGTPGATSPLAAALFSSTRRAVLGMLLGRPEQSFYLREIVRAVGGGPGAVQRELARFTRVGLIRRFAQGNQVRFQADPDCPIYPELRAIMLKTVGLADVLRAALQPLAARCRLAFVYGSLARGEERSASDVDICVVGALTFAEVVSALAAAQERIGRETNPSVYTPEEFARKLASGHHFVASLARGPKLWLIGDARELGRLGG